MSVSPGSGTKNHLLAALPKDEFERLLPHLQSVQLPHGKVIYEIGDVIEHVYFPIGALISLVTQMADGKVVEVGLVGNDGMSGLRSLLGSRPSYERAIVQIPNGAMRTTVAVVKEEFNKGKSFHDLLLGYANDFISQVSQTAACNATHTIEERLSRWLLMCHDRIDSARVNLTQEFIAEMLGTRRASVTSVAISLQSAGLIKYNRGDINIIDRPGLEAFSCECYETIRSRKSH